MGHRDGRGMSVEMLSLLEWVSVIGAPDDCILVFVKEEYNSLLWHI